MGSVTIRTGQTSQGLLGLSPWNDSRYPYSVSMINLGNNFISTLEIVSSLNSFNITRIMYGYNYQDRVEKYNPKIYLGTIQTASPDWNYDRQNGQNWEEKSGSLNIR